ncbi:hypothetical protein LTR16_008252, partial [Cryomyces antarcticus]
MESMIDEDDSDNSDDDDVEMLTPEELQDHFARMSMRHGDTSMSTTIDLTTSPEPQVQAHNGTIELPLVEEDSWIVYGASIRPGNTVELQSGYTDKGGHHSGDFLRISHIIRNVQNDQVTLRGTRLRRTMFFNGMLERKLNEVAMVIHSNADDARPALQQGLEEVSLEEVVAVRELILTNHKFPSLSFRDEVFWNVKPLRATNLLDMDYKTQAPLVCRWVVNYVYEDPTTRKKGLLGHTTIRTLQEAECDGNLSIPH